MPDETPAQETERRRLSATHFANYQEYNKTLRTWFVTFGLGVPSLFLINHDLGLKLLAFAHHTRVIAFYLIGCAIQVFIAVVNKFIAWHSYDDYQTVRVRDAWLHAAIRKIENSFWIDMIADLVTAGFFACATWMVFQLYT